VQRSAALNITSTVQIMSTPSDEEKIASDQIDPTFNADTADFCARELAKSQRMQHHAVKDKQKTAVLLASVTPTEQAVIQSFKQELESESRTPDESS